MSLGTVVYSGTRNLYEQMYVSLKSVLINTPNVNAYLFIEDDEFPYPLPENVKTINVSNQTIFRKDGANYTTRFSYMTLIRGALARILKEDRVLSLDCDVIAIKDISSIFDIDIDNYYFSAAKEPIKSQGRLYTNTGVCLYNLKLLRESGMADKVIDALNNNHYDFCEQDCFNSMCQGKIKEMNSKYNATMFTESTNEVIIKHFASIKDWTSDKDYKKYLYAPYLK